VCVGAFHPVLLSRHIYPQSDFIQQFYFATKAGKSSRNGFGQIKSNTQYHFNNKNTRDTIPLFLSDNDQVENRNLSEFKRGDKILVEVLKFGRLGASIDVVGKGHDVQQNMIGPEEATLGSGLILQSEIHYFRAARDGLDVVKGEVLPAYVERVRDDFKLDVSLRPPGYAAKTEQLADTILRVLQESPDGTLPVGDKSTPEDINRVFPGASKGAFKKAVSALFKQRKLKPEDNSISLVKSS